MTTFVVIGAGPGLGAAAARRFAAEGLSVGLVARDPARLAELADTLRGEGVTVATAPADARRPAELTAALGTLADELGPVEVLQFSPIPAATSLRCVTDTGVDELTAAVEMSVYGPVAAVGAVLPGMRERGRGSVLLVNGGSAVTPSPRAAGTSVAFAGLSAWARLLHDELAGTGVGVAQLVVPGAIEEGHPEKDPARLADRLWELHVDPSRFRVVVGG